MAIKSVVFTDEFKFFINGAPKDFHLEKREISSLSNRFFEASKNGAVTLFEQGYLSPYLYMSQNKQNTNLDIGKKAILFRGVNIEIEPQTPAEEIFKALMAFTRPADIMARTLLGMGTKLEFGIMDVFDKLKITGTFKDGDFIYEFKEHFETFLNDLYLHGDSMLIKNYFNDNRIIFNNGYIYRQSDFFGDRSQLKKEIEDLANNIGQYCRQSGTILNIEKGKLKACSSNKSFSDRYFAVKNPDLFNGAVIELERGATANCINNILGSFLENTDKMIHYFKTCKYQLFTAGGSLFINNRSLSPFKYWEFYQTLGLDENPFGQKPPSNKQKIRGKKTAKINYTPVAGSAKNNVIVVFGQCYQINDRDAYLPLRTHYKSLSKELAKDNGCRDRRLYLEKGILLASTSTEPDQYDISNKERFENVYIVIKKGTDEAVIYNVLKSLRYKTKKAIDKLIWLGAEVYTNEGPANSHKHTKIPYTNFDDFKKRLMPEQKTGIASTNNTEYNDEGGKEISILTLRSLTSGNQAVESAKMLFSRYGKILKPDLLLFIETSKNNKVREMVIDNTDNRKVLRIFLMKNDNIALKAFNKYYIDDISTADQQDLLDIAKNTESYAVKKALVKKTGNKDILFEILMGYGDAASDAYEKYKLLHINFGNKDEAKEILEKIGESNSSIVRIESQRELKKI